MIKIRIKIYIRFNRVAHYEAIKKKKIQEAEDAFSENTNV